MDSKSIDFIKKVLGAKLPKLMYEIAKKPKEEYFAKLQYDENVAVNFYLLLLEAMMHWS